MATPGSQSGTKKMSPGGGDGVSGGGTALVFIVLMATLTVPAMAVSDPTESKPSSSYPGFLIMSQSSSLWSVLLQQFVD
jgi:hypothetical protein